MKKIFGIIMAITLLLLVTACGSGDDSSPSPSPSTPMPAENVAEDSPRESSDIPSDTETYDTPSEDNTVEELPDPDVISLRDQTFYSVSPFSEGRAWVQYLDDNQMLVTAVINTDGELVFTPEQEVIGYLPYCDGYAVYLYTADPTQKASSDNARSCIVDIDGRITYDSSADGCRFIIAYGNGNFLALEHVSNFEKDEWSLGCVDKDGKVLVAFKKCDSFNGYPRSLLYECKYLDEGIFLLKNTMYDLNSQKAIYEVKTPFGDSPVDFVKGVFHDGRALIFAEGLLDAGFANLTSTGERTVLITGNLTGSEVSEYEDGLFFYKDQYYDIDGNSKIAFPQYSGKYLRGGTFHEGYAPLYIKGADGYAYFTIIDLQGNILFDPIPGYPSESLNEGYLVVQTGSGSALYDTTGKKVGESRYNITGGIGQDSVKVTDGYYVAHQANQKSPTVFVGVDGSQIGQ